MSLIWTTLRRRRTLLTRSQKASRSELTRAFPFQVRENALMHAFQILRRPTLLHGTRAIDGFPGVSGEGMLYSWVCGQVLEGAWSSSVHREGSGGGANSELRSPGCFG